MAELLHGDLTWAVIGAAMEVHRTLGHGFLEAVYEAALAHELDLRGITYKGQVVGEYVADFVVDGKVIAELKATKGLTEA